MSVLPEHLMASTRVSGYIHAESGGCPRGCRGEGVGSQPPLSATTCHERPVHTGLLLSKTQFSGKSCESTYEFSCLSFGGVCMYIADLQKTRLGCSLSTTCVCPGHLRLATMNPDMGGGSQEGSLPHSLCDSEPRLALSYPMLGTQLSLSGLPEAQANKCHGAGPPLKVD